MSLPPFAKKLNYFLNLGLTNVRIEDKTTEATVVDATQHSIFIEIIHQSFAINIRVFELIVDHISLTLKNLDPADLLKS